MHVTPSPGRLSGKEHVHAIMKTEIFTTVRRAILAALSLLILLTSASSRAQQETAPAAAPVPASPAQQPDATQRGRGERNDRGANNNFQRGGFGGINFDEKQRELLQEARQVNGDELRKLNDKLAEAQKEFVKAVVAEKYDETAVRAKADAIGKIQAEILALNGKAFATVSPTLKPEQRESIEGNARVGIAIINPAGGFGGGPGGAVIAGPGRGNFGGGGDAAFGGGRGNFGGGDVAPGADRTIRRGGIPGGPAGGNDAGNNRRRGGENRGQ
jgi:Spy/CpxP family protein refolding chaperone